jgi:hypothetical protein
VGAGPGLRAGEDNLTCRAPFAIVRAPSPSTALTRAQWVVLMINDPRVLVGGPVSFVARMEPGQAPPASQVLAVVAPDNDRRLFMIDYRIHFTRAEPSAIRVSEARVRSAESANAVNEAAITFAGAAAEFLGEGPGLSAEEREVLDGRGNADGGHDLGDLRYFLARNPSQIPTSSSWSP